MARVVRRIEFTTEEIKAIETVSRLLEELYDERESLKVEEYENDELLFDMLAMTYEWQ